MKRKYYQVVYDSEEAEDFDLGLACEPDNWNYLQLYGTRGKPFPNIILPLLTLKNGGFADYQASNVGTLCSHKLMSVLEANKAESDVLEWFDIFIANEQGEQRKYHLLHFPVVFDVLDLEHSVISHAMDGLPVIPCLSYPLVKDHHVFAMPKASVGFFISDFVREKILEADCLGLGFAPVKAI